MSAWNEYWGIDLDAFDLDNCPDFLMKDEDESCEQYTWKFAEPGVPDVMVRLTGGSEIADEYLPGLTVLERALSGWSPDGFPQPRICGYWLAGGNRYLQTDNPWVPIPGITEVLPKIQCSCPEARCFGVSPKRDRKMKPTPFGLVFDRHVHKDPATGKPMIHPRTGRPVERFSVFHPTLRATLAIQKTADLPSPYHAEYKQCHRYVDQAGRSGYTIGLVCYNGGGIVEEEINLYTDEGKPVLLIRDSGRKTSEYANNTTWLSRNPSVRVAELDVDSIRRELLGMGVMKWPLTVGPR
jgi:hypothetical protein